MKEVFHTAEEKKAGRSCKENFKLLPDRRGPYAQTGKLRYWADRQPQPESALWNKKTRVEMKLQGGKKRRDEGLL